MMFFEIFFFIISIHSLKLSDLKNTYKVISNYTLPEGPIFAKGWIKYTNFMKDEKIKPREFFKNNAFYEQFKNNQVVDIGKKDIVGFINIPDEDHFFLALTENSINVISSRKINLAKTVDILSIHDIIKTTEDFKGGIEDHGDFREGYCFKIRTEKRMKENIWELCTLSSEEKLNWMNAIFSVQRKSIKSLKTLEEDSSFKNMMASMRKGISSELVNQIKSTNNATWMPISSWSECSKPCGSGKSYLHRICILPENSQNQCEGERVLSQDCNVFPCDENIKNNTSINPVMSFVPMSKRPVKYERCIIKEGDLAILINEGSLKGAKIPVRIVLNNRTLTLFSNDQYESIIISHRLAGITGLRNLDNDNTCFEIEEGVKKTILCSFASISSTLQELAKEWQTDIHDFIKNCADSYSNELDYKEMNSTSDKVQDALSFFQEKEKEKMEKVIIRTQQLALQAIEKELKVENMIEKEEDQKEILLSDDVKKDYEKVLKQQELIAKALEQKKKEAEIYSNKLNLKSKMKQIYEEFQKQIEKIRTDLKARILAKQRDNSRKRELITTKINEIKKTISHNLLKASKNGNIEECDPERPTQEIILYYVFKMSECVKNDNFCSMCCEAEFGDLHLEQRSDCYAKCDDFYIYKKKFEHEREDDDNEIKLFKKKDETNTTETFTNSTNITTENETNESNPDPETIINLIEKTKKTELLKMIKNDLNNF